MAKRITALRKLRPEFKQQRTLQTDELVEQIARRTSLSKGQILLVTYEIRDWVSFFGIAGYAAKIDGFGTFTPRLLADGSLTVGFRPDKEFIRELNASSITVPIRNRASIGKTSQQLINQWNELHPEDPVED